jgi:hypothetical protein
MLVRQVCLLGKVVALSPKSLGVRPSSSSNPRRRAACVCLSACLRPDRAPATRLADERRATCQPRLLLLCGFLSCAMPLQSRHSSLHLPHASFRIIQPLVPPGPTPQSHAPDQPTGSLRRRSEDAKDGLPLSLAIRVHRLPVVVAPLLAHANPVLIVIREEVVGQADPLTDGTNMIRQNHWNASPWGEAPDSRDHEMIMRNIGRGMRCGRTRISSLTRCALALPQGWMLHRDTSRSSSPRPRVSHMLCLGQKDVSPVVEGPYYLIHPHTSARLSSHLDVVIFVRVHPDHIDHRFLRSSSPVHIDGVSASAHHARWARHAASPGRKEARAGELVACVCIVIRHTSD